MIDIQSMNSPPDFSSAYVMEDTPSRYMAWLPEGPELAESRRDMRRFLSVREALLAILVNTVSSLQGSCTWIFHVASDWDPGAAA